MQLPGVKRRNSTNYLLQITDFEREKAKEKLHILQQKSAADLSRFSP
jgi:hypothetical protein